ncbi:uncharacterized protein FOMMEDRAFT_153488 [Fomitiporia mediterranea MF3/22]|uniref:uncharacterized protein n=1 Tax=Fomitiporia mediterranea (strain MF3/22) TaxID=694068 RepID=UPI00044075FA|nr:uncharacterized protein FOMMEDRAFT_153488 [Fomitiporia mediterranea MF3/22]EJD06115.1 hypothetical protein FOMMEDRAFT_153488 [Fomitiporia mediterranea MF3/22]
MPPMDASTPVCPMIVPNAPLSHIAPCAKLQSPQSIYPSSLATVLLLLPSTPGRTSRLHCVSLHSPCRLPWSLTTPARVRSHFPLLSPPQSVRSARSLSPYPYITRPVRERESKHPADFSKQPDDGAHDDNDDNDEGLRPSGSGGASSARQPSGSSGGTMGGNAGMSGRNKSGTGFNSSSSKYFRL